MLGCEGGGSTGSCSSALLEMTSVWDAQNWSRPMEPPPVLNAEVAAAAPGIGTECEEDHSVLSYADMDIETLSAIDSHDYLSDRNSDIPSINLSIEED